MMTVDIYGLSVKHDESMDCRRGIYCKKHSRVSPVENPCITRMKYNST